MALEVEDGTAKSNSESYASVLVADTYLANRGMTSWAALSTADKEINLRLGTDYMLRAYRLRWNGTRVLTTQALDWPRYNVPIPDMIPSGGYYIALIESNVVPTEVQRACVELAYRASTGEELLEDLETPVIREKVGPLEVEYAEGARQTKVYPAVDAMLAHLFSSGGGMLKVYRA